MWRLENVNDRRKKRSKKNFMTVMKGKKMKKCLQSHALLTFLWHGMIILFCDCCLLNWTSLTFLQKCHRCEMRVSFYKVKQQPRWWCHSCLIFYVNSHHHVKEMCQESAFAWPARPLRFFTVFATSFLNFLLLLGSKNLLPNISALFLSINDASVKPQVVSPYKHIN